MEWLYLYIFFAGLFWGSFLNVLADRLSREESINGRSKCESCKHTLAWYDLIPIISFTLLKGKCRYCKASLSIGYPISELLTGVILLLSYVLTSMFYKDLPHILIYMGIASVIVVILLSDLRYQIIPDEMQIAFILLAVANLLVSNINFQQNIFEQVVTVQFLQNIGWFLLSGITVMLPLLAIFLLTKGRGMGFGDVKLAFSMGLILGLWNGLLALYIAFMVGGIIGIFILAIKRGSMKTKIAFGPFLLIGLYVMIYFEYWFWMWMQRIYHF